MSNNNSRVFAIGDTVDLRDDRGWTATVVGVAPGNKIKIQPNHQQDCEPFWVFTFEYVNVTSEVTP